MRTRSAYQVAAVQASYSFPNRQHSYVIVTALMNNLFCCLCMRTLCTYLYLCGCVCVAAQRHLFVCGECANFCTLLQRISILCFADMCMYGMKLVLLLCMCHALYVCCGKDFASSALSSVLVRTLFHSCVHTEQHHHKLPAQISFLFSPL